MEGSAEMAWRAVDVIRMLDFICSASAQHLAFGHREPFVERQSGAVERTFSDSTYMGVKLLGHAVQLTRILT